MTLSTIWAQLKELAGIPPPAPKLKEVFGPKDPIGWTEAVRAIRICEESPSQENFDALRGLLRVFLDDPFMENIYPRESDWGDGLILTVQFQDLRPFQMRAMVSDEMREAIIKRFESEPDPKGGVPAFVRAAMIGFLFQLQYPGIKRIPA